MSKSIKENGKPESLLHFFETTYLSERKLKEITEACYRTKLRRLERWHGKSVTLADMADGLLDRFQADLAQRTSAKKAYEVIGNIRCVWRLASGEEKKTKKRRLGSPGSLRHFFETVYKGERNLTRGTTARYRQQINRIERWHGGEVLLADLGDDFIERFKVDLAQSNVAPQVEKAHSVVRCVWRLACEKELAAEMQMPESQATQRLVEGEAEDGPVSLWAVYSERYVPHMLALRSPGTRLQYEVQLRHFARFLGCTPTTEHLTDEVMSAFLVDRADGGNAPTTTNKARNHLLSLWRWCNRKGLVKFGPDVLKMVEPMDPPVAFTLNELLRLFAAADDAWWEALLRSIFDTGERISAVMQWEWSMLDLESGDLTVPARIRKGRRRGKVYRLRAPTLELLRTLDQRKFIFQWPGCVGAMYYQFNRIAKRAGLPRGRQWRFHAIRKSHASYLKAAGGDPTESLGHSSRETTERYLSPRIITQNRSSDLLPDLPALAAVERGGAS